MMDIVNICCLMCMFEALRTVTHGVVVAEPNNNPSQSAKAIQNVSKSFLDNLLEGMDSRIIPTNEDGQVQVQCGFHIVSVGSVSEISMDFKSTILFRAIWTDHRLAYDPENGPPSVSLFNKAKSDIWVPDIYFPNEKEAKFHDITVPNSLMKVYPNGSVIQSVRITLRMACPMNLASFPLDTQICSIKLESFAYDNTELLLKWMDNAVVLDDDLELPQFDIKDIKRHANCLKSYKTTGNFSCLKADLILKRQFGFFLLQTYIPSMLIVILSWVSFWINMDAVPARISLGVTTVLTMTTQLSASTNSIPKVSYPKAIDVWLSMCMIFVFASLLEYAFVNALSRKYKKDKYKKTDDAKDKVVETQLSSDTDDGFEPAIYFKRFANCNQRSVAQNIDKISRVVFPSAFTLFNVIYWPVYTIGNIPN